MKLYEVISGGIGNSYVRAYVWAEDEPKALELYRRRNPKRTIEEVKELFDQSSPPFSTLADDDGWEN